MSGGGERAARRALELVGTPFHHQGRAAGVGLDCIGMVVLALREGGLVVRDRLDYSQRPDGKALREALLGHGACEVGDLTLAEAGDVLLFRYDGQPQHVALALGGGRMAHAFAPACGVVATEIGRYWERRLVGVFRLPLD